MNDLFLKDEPDYQVEKTASEAFSHFMSEDSTQWVKEIINYFLERFPYLQEEPISVSWSKQEPKKGYAVGNLNVIGISVPLIINNFMLAPMDVMILPETTLPLTDFFVQQIYNKPEAFKGLKMDTKTPLENLFGGHNSLQFSPISEYSGSQNSMTRDAVKVASVIDKLSFVHSDDVKEILEELKQPEVARAFEKRGHVDIVKKLVEKAKQSTKTASLEDYLRDVDIDRQLVYKDSAGNHFVKQANSRFNKTWITKISSLEAAELEEVLVNSEKAPKMEKIASKTELSIKQAKVGDSGKLGWLDGSDFRPVGDIFITNIEPIDERPKFANFALQNDEKTRINISSDRSFAKTASVLDSTMGFDEIPGEAPKIGQFGVFVTEKTASVPFTITGMRKHATVGGWEIRGEHGFLQKIAFYPINVANEGFEQHENEKQAFYVPKNAKWVTLKDENEKLAVLKNFEAKIKVEGLNGLEKVALYITDDENLEKPVFMAKEVAYLCPQNETLFVDEHYSAEFTKNAESILNKHQVYRDKAGLYNFAGPQFTKYASETPIRNLSQIDAKWTLVHCGGTEEDLEKFASLAPNHHFDIEGTISAPLPISTLDSYLDTEFEKQAGKKLKIAKLLVKEAASLSDKSSVDAVLSLNLLRRRNIEEYLAALPLLEESLTSLSKLLIASRLGLQNAQPEPIKIALEALTDVIIQLYELQATIKKVK